MADEEQAKVSFITLADELIDMILSYELLDYKDICRFSQVCVRFHTLGMSREVWKRRALRRWKVWRKCSTDDWVQIFKGRAQVEKRILHLVERLTRNSFVKADIPDKQYIDLLDMVELCNNDQEGFIESTLAELSSGDPRKVNLTHRHYADRLLACLRRHELKNQWQKLLFLPEDQQCLEDGAVLIAQWIRYNKPPEVTQNVNTELERMAQEALQVAGVSSQPEWEATEDRVAAPVAIEGGLAPGIEGEAALDGQQYRGDPTKCLRILEAVREVMFTVENFCGNSEDYYDLDNSMINEVLEKKKGIPITLAIVFTAVARRLGVKVEAVNFPNHFLLRWRCNLDPQCDDSLKYRYIDCFNGGRFLSKDQCLSNLYGGYNRWTVELPVASPKDVWTRMLANIIYICQSTTRLDSRLRCLRHALELKTLLNPEDRESKLLQARVFVHLGINLTEAIGTLEYLGGRPSRSDRLAMLLQDARTQKENEHEEETERLKPKLRSDPKNVQVTYRVGMVMRHRRYHYGCVIWGWNYYCDMSDAWIQQMGVDRLPNGRNQPFYNVLGDDGTSRYAAEENLEEEPNQDFNRHPDLGKYFKAWKGDRYVPNYVLQSVYPDDNAVEE